MATPPVRYGIIGTGMMGVEHIANVNALPGARVVAIADPHEPSRDAGAAAAADPVSVYADHRDLLAAGDFDSIVVAAVAYAVSLYNALIQVKHQVDQAWSNIDVLLKQRHDELPKLVDAAQAYMGHERSLLEKLTALRARAATPGQGEDRLATESEPVALTACASLPATRSSAKSHATGTKSASTSKASFLYSAALLPCVAAVPNTSV